MDTSDRIYTGAAEIAARVFGTDTPQNRRRVYFLADRKELPCFIFGGRLSLRESTYARHLAALERAAADTLPPAA